MGTIRKMKLGIKIRVAIAYSLFVLVVCIGLLLFLNFSLQDNINNKSIIYKIAPDTAFITINELKKDIVFAPIIKKDDPRLYDQRTLDASQFDILLGNEIYKRVSFFSLIAILLACTGTFAVSYLLSGHLMKPLSALADKTHQLTPENLSFRLDIPNAEDELLQLTQAYNRTLDRLQGAFYNLEQFNSYASHELRNALAVLKTRLEVDSQTGNHKETISFSLEYVNQITKTIDDMLALSSLQLKDKYEPVDMALMAAKAVDEYAAIGKQISLDIPDEGVSPVKGREVWLYRAVANLLDNAVKHSGEQGVIRVSLKESFKAVILSVTDNGRGISKEEQAYIWEPYYKAPSPHKNGMGLGLAMVKHVVDIMGGFVWVDSEQGKGSTFYISLPVYS